MISFAALRAVMAREDRDDPRYWAIRWQYMKGGGFFDDLLRAAAHADSDNLSLLSLGFPALAEGVSLWKNREGWARGVEAWAESLVHDDDRDPGPRPLTFGEQITQEKNIDRIR